MVVPGSTMAALSITYFAPRDFMCPLRRHRCPPAHNNSVIVCRRSIAVPPSSAAAPPCTRRYHPPLIYIATNYLPLPSVAVAAVGAVINAPDSHTQGPTAAAGPTAVHDKGNNHTIWEEKMY